MITTTAGKGVINDNHPLVISGGTVRAEAREYLSKADLILAIGTEMAETDNYVGKYSINGKIVRIDIDDKKIDDNYKATVGLVGDAKETVKKLNAKLNNSVSLEKLESGRNAVIEIKRKIDANLTKSEKRHKKLLTILRKLPLQKQYFQLMRANYLTRVFLILIFLKQESGCIRLGSVLLVTPAKRDRSKDGTAYDTRSRSSWGRRIYVF